MRIARLCCALLLSGFAFAAQAKMVHKPVEWTQDGTRFHSVLVYDDAVTAKRPGLVMVPNWYGVNDLALKKAEGIAGKDYVILVTDMYGENVRPTSDDQAMAAVKVAVRRSRLDAQAGQPGTGSAKGAGQGRPHRSFEAGGDRLLLRRFGRARPGAQRCRYCRRRIVPWRPANR